MIRLPHRGRGVARAWLPFCSGFGQRRLVQWLIAYLAGAWLLLQVLDLVGDAFDWPDVVGRGAIVLLGVGFLASS